MKYRPRRRVTSFEAVVTTEDGPLHAKIVDVTELGARLRLEHGELEPESRISIALHGGDRKATVIWNKPGEAGIRFDTILPLDVLAAVNRSLYRPELKKKRFLMP